MNLPQGYGDKPMDYGDSPVFLESQMKAHGKARALEAAQHILEMWKEPWPVTQMRFIDRLEHYVESLK
jgi:hypothetical protein